MFCYIPRISEKIWESKVFWVLWVLILLIFGIYFYFKKNK